MRIRSKIGPLRVALAAAAAAAAVVVVVVTTVAIVIVYLISMILTINIYRFPTQYSPTGLSNGRTLCSLSCLQVS